MSLTLSLYRDILKKARLFDKRPVLKVHITPPALSHVFEVLAEERQVIPRDPYFYYTPHSFGGKSFYHTFKELFKDGIRSQSATGMMNAFNLIRDLNDTYAVATNQEGAQTTQPLSIKEQKDKKSSSEVFVIMSYPKKKSGGNDDLASILGGINKMVKNRQLFDVLDTFEKQNKEEEKEEEKEEREREEKEKGRKGEKDTENEIKEGEVKVSELEKIVEEERVVEKVVAKEDTGKDEITGAEVKKEVEGEEKNEEKNEERAKPQLWVRASDKIGVGTILISHPAHDRHDNKDRVDCFYKSTVLITGVTSKAVYGLMLNKPMQPNEAKDKYQTFTAPHKNYKKFGIASMPEELEKANWSFGGPVDIHPSQPFNLSFPTFSALHSDPQGIPDTTPLLDGLHGGGAMAKLLQMIKAGTVDMKKMRLFVGGAAWGPNQLRDEINRGWWIQAEASPDFIFGNYENSYEKHWEDALTLMGGEYLNFVQAAKEMSIPKNFEFDKSRVPYCTLQMLNINLDNL